MVDFYNDLSESKITEKIHIRIQQRNGRKSITIIENLPLYIEDLKSFTKYINKTYCCGGNINSKIEEKIVIQFQGDQRNNIQEILINKYNIPKINIVIHGI